MLNDSFTGWPNLSVLQQIQQSTIITSMNTTILFNPDGNAQCLWTDAIPLHELGQLQITRASHIEFNNSTQQWEVKDRKGQMRFFSKSRSACLEWEHQNMQPELHAGHEQETPCSWYRSIAATPTEPLTQADFNRIGFTNWQR